MITELINDEQLLEILLENQAIYDYNMEGFSGELITLYCMNKVGVGASFDTVYEEVTKLVTSHVCENLVKDGLIYPVFAESGIEYQSTDEGKKLIEMYKKLGVMND
jgi:hypothetical protein